MQNKLNIIDNLHYSFNLLRRNKHQNKDSVRGKGRLFALLQEHQQNGITQRELAEKLDVKPSSMSELVQKLEHRGFITKTQDKNDKRSFKIFLTEAGSEKIEESKLEKSRFINDVFKDFNETEIDNLSNLLEKLTSSLKLFSEQDEESESCRHKRFDENKHGHHHRHGKHHHHKRAHRHGNEQLDINKSDE